MSATSGSEKQPWWRGAAIYQIYPRSFQDSNGDGVGDLKGITQRLDYVAELGVDAVWISPFFTSPMRDFGYDVANYCEIDPLFGSLADFDELISTAHQLGLKVIIDQVYAHTSDLHPWFAASRSAADDPKANWYVWADAKPDGAPPNNWQSVFGGPAWTWDARRKQYYMHTFLKEQPQLNAHNPDVQDALLNVMRFWLDRGVDGFRLDALNHSMHDQRLRNNPAAPEDGRTRTRPFDYQIKKYSQSQPGVIAFIERIRALCDEYGAIHTVAEVGGDKAIAEMKAYTRGNKRLNSAYGFDLLYAPALTPQVIIDATEPWAKGSSWPSWAFENHDAPRAVSRWCKPEDSAQFAPMKMALLLALRGNPIIYQGEELGLVQDDIPFEMLQDPEAIANWPLTLSRDGVRTPFPWDGDEPNGGFTGGTPWLPLSPANRAKAVSNQEPEPTSLLHHTRNLLALRNVYPALRLGTLRDASTQAGLLSFTRTHRKQNIFCLFNTSPHPAKVKQPLPSGEIILALNDASRDQLPGYGVLFLILE